MVQMAWNFVNDSLSTTVCLQWEPEIIAVALIHLASKLSKFSVVDWSGRQSHHLRWWDMFVADVTMEILEDICHQVLDLYQSNQTESTAESPPQLPPSKASPPVKRANTSPIVQEKSPPVVKSVVPPPQPVKTEVKVEVKAAAPVAPLAGNPIPKIVTDNVVRPSVVPAMDASSYSYPPAFGTMSYPVPHQPQPPPPQIIQPQHHPSSGYRPPMPVQAPSSTSTMYSSQYSVPHHPPQHYPPHPQPLMSQQHHHHQRHRHPHSSGSMHHHPSSIPPNYYGMQPNRSRSYYHPPP